jgi:hypothetical protein
MKVPRARLSRPVTNQFQKKASRRPVLRRTLLR